MVYKKPVLESYSAFGVFGEGYSGENDAIACTAAAEDNSEDDLGLNAADNV